LTETVTSILVVDDEPGIRELLSGFLGQHGYKVSTAKDGAAMGQALSRERFDLIVLDLMMPGEDGLSICRRLSVEPDGPAIIMLSAMGEDTDRIIGLELGADDYLPKPCNPRELLARIKAVLRRRPDAVSADRGAGYLFLGWHLDMVRRELLSPEQVTISLSSGEFGLLRVFIERPQRILSRDQLLEAARGQETESFDRSIDVQISRLRRKLADSEGQSMIRTIRNEGYMFTPKVTRG
jgi:two-component system OmpR family response regulator